MWQGKGGRAETLTAVAVFSPVSPILFLLLPLRTDVPLRDRQPLFVQTQACPVLCYAACMCVRICVDVPACRPLHAYLRPLRNVQEITGKTELNIM